MAGTFVVSHQPKVSIPLGAPDYLAHGVSYAVLGALYVRALASGRLIGMTMALVAPAVLLALVYGITDEFHQSFIPGRFPSVSDVVADTLGALVGACVAAAAGAWLRRRAARLYT